jgi:hypothetical protein
VARAVAQLRSPVLEWLAMKPYNLTNLDFRYEAQTFQALPFPIIDCHTHIHGRRAAAIFREVAKSYGVQKVYSMTTLEELSDVRAELGDMLELIAFPIFRGSDPAFEHGAGYVERIRQYHHEGAKIVKFWAAPRGKDFAEQWNIPGALDLDTPTRRQGMEVACELGMSIMVHIADPDTWFQTMYKDSNRYGTFHLKS